MAHPTNMKQSVSSLMMSQSQTNKHRTNHFKRKRLFIIKNMHRSNNYNINLNLFLTHWQAIRNSIKWFLPEVLRLHYNTSLCSSSYFFDFLNNSFYINIFWKQISTPLTWQEFSGLWISLRGWHLRVGINRFGQRSAGVINFLMTKM